MCGGNLTSDHKCPQNIIDLPTLKEKKEIITEIERMLNCGELHENAIIDMYKHWRRSINYINQLLHDMGADPNWIAEVNDYLEEYSYLLDE